MKDIRTDWVETCIWWHVYPLGFTGAPVRGGQDSKPRLRALENWLDYAVELGTSGLLLGPIFESESHGYDSLDQFRIDPRLGTTRDFDHLIAACKKRGIRVLLDGVFNHVGVGHPLLQRALTEGPRGEYADFFQLDWTDEASPGLGNFEGHTTLAALRHQNSAVADYVEKVMCHWLEHGIDGWRLDAAYAVPGPFWAEVLGRVRKQYPEAWFLGEVIHGPYDDFIAASTIDSLTQYELWKAIWSSITDRNYWELDAALARHNEFLESQIPATFVGNHDVTRIATAVGAPGAILALTVLVTVGGIPSIYYGDEQGYTGTKREQFGGDDEVRPPMPGHPEELSLLGQEVFRAHQDLLGLRRRHPWLTTARTRQIGLTNESYVYRSESVAGDAWIEVQLDLSAEYRARITDHKGVVLFDFAAE